MERAIAIDYPEAYYLHLTRHPVSTRASMREFSAAKHAKDKVEQELRQRADRLVSWHHIHSNILRFTASLPLGQTLRIKGEDVLSDPDRYLSQVAEWMGLRTDAAAPEAMRHPETLALCLCRSLTRERRERPQFMRSPKLRRRTREGAFSPRIPRGRQNHGLLRVLRRCRQSQRTARRLRRAGLRRDRRTLTRWGIYDDADPSGRCGARAAGRRRLREHHPPVWHPAAPARSTPSLRSPGLYLGAISSAEARVDLRRILRFESPEGPGRFCTATPRLRVATRRSRRLPRRRCRRPPRQPPRPCCPVRGAGSS
jgi:hypothetical protein